MRSRRLAEVREVVVAGHEQRVRSVALEQDELALVLARDRRGAREHARATARVAQHEARVAELLVLEWAMRPGAGAQRDARPGLARVEHERRALLIEREPPADFAGRVQELEGLRAQDGIRRRARRREPRDRAQRRRPDQRALQPPTRPLQLRYTHAQITLVHGKTSRTELEPGTRGRTDPSGLLVCTSAFERREGVPARRARSTRQDGLLGRASEHELLRARTR